MEKNNKVPLFRRISFKIIGVATIALIIVLIINNYIAVSFSKNRLTDAGIENIQNIANEKIAAMEQYVQGQKVIATLVSINDTIIVQAATYQATGQMDPEMQTKISAMLATLNDKTGGIYENFFVTFGAEGFADCLNNQTLHNVADEPFYQECATNGHFYGINVSPVTGRTVYVIAFAITNPNTGDFLGTVNASIDMEAFSQAILSSDDYTISVLNHDGVIIANNTNPDDILLNLSETNPDGIKEIKENGEGHMIVDLTAYGMPISYMTYKVSDNFIIEVSINQDVILNPANDMKKNLTVVSGFCGVIGLIIVLIVIILIVRPIRIASKQVSELVKDLKEGNGDLTKELKKSSKDEIGNMVGGVNHLIKTMAEIISDVQKTVENVSETTETINKQISTADDEISNVSSTMEEMSASSEETSASMTQVMVQVDQVAQLVENVNNQSTTQAKFASQVVDKVQSIKDKSAIEREEANKHLNEVTESLQVKIENAKQVKEIANLTSEILNITSKTNLLALNASIEAARAGEAGKGFAVVADEIRQLADSSQGAANRIQEVTNNVIGAVEALASEASGVTEYMIENNEKNHEGTASLTESYSTDIQSLAESMINFKNDSNEIKESMSAIKEAVDSVNVAAEETAKGITNVAEAMSEMAEQLQSISNSSNKSVEQISELSDEMSKFKV